MSKDITKHISKELEENSGDTIHVPDGDYKVTAPLNVPPNTSIEGEGDSLTEIHVDHDGDVAVVHEPTAPGGPFQKIKLIPRPGDADPQERIQFVPEPPPDPSQL